METVFKVLVLGGYGNFGKRISESLAKQHSTLKLLIAGRNSEKAEQLCNQLKGEYPANSYQAISIDIHAPNFQDQLMEIRPHLVIHTSGPFQGQDYRVPEACLAAGSHYIDLADDRRFVCDITRLDQQAQEQNLLLVSGASSVPGLSSSVIDHLLPKLQSLKTIDFAIAPGNQLERGIATIRAILSYTGHPFPVWENNIWSTRYGWMDTSIRDFGPPVGKRWLSNIDIPDLELFPERYPGVETVKFQAGLELGLLHNTMVAMAWLAKHRIINNWAPFANIAMKTSNIFYPFGTDIGGMNITLNGIDHDGQPKTISWTLTATQGVGPHIPTIPAIVLTMQLIKGELQKRGAMPCCGLMSLDDFSSIAQSWGITQDISQQDPSNNSHSKL